jgi:hypothetical protein
MGAWMIAAGMAVAGDTTLGIRLAAVLAPIVGTLALWRSTFLLFGSEVATTAAWFSLAMPLLAVGAIVMTPDLPSVLFWGLMGWAVVELYASRRGVWWLAIGLFAGLGFLSKYTNLIAGAGVLIWLLAVPANRTWFRSWQLWTGGLVALMVSLPVVIWNEQHHWASFQKQFGRVAEGHQLTLRHLGELLGAGFLLASPVIAVLAVLGLWRAARDVWTNRSEAHLLLLAGALPLPLYFLIHSLHDRVQANWPAPVYPSLAAGAAMAAVAMGAAGKRLVRWGLAVGFALVALIYAHAEHPLVGWPNFRDPTAQGRGWEHLALAIDEKRQATGAKWVTAPSYALTGELSFALRRRIPVFPIVDAIRYANLPPAPDWVIQAPGLFVDEEGGTDKAYLEGRFEHVSQLGPVLRAAGPSAATTYDIYLVQGVKGELTKQGPR